jgi:hypothetical protein
MKQFPQALPTASSAYKGISCRVSAENHFAMIAKCANPACSVPFHYLRDGKLFRMEFDPDRSPSGPKLVGSAKPARRIEHFWLCGPCSAKLTVVMAGGQVKTIPLAPFAFRRAAAS